ncbi:Fc receptor-like protein 1 isoform X2 [Phyllostomus hastatus]|uniref:Fc receptor-like protein 1 isoform X2 n=1 Tax=Phyllostomus hastatus TaxID=9423 RepID=UPI001E681BCC|nr:Fc receptor-like protein 1 isoform X2 [Phyllostomus hastatus]
MLLKLLLLICVPLCKPTVLLLTASPSWPIEGNSMTLTCKTQYPPEKLGVQLQFCFFKDGYTLGLSWNNSTELQITAVRREDSGSYWCEAQTAGTKVIRSKSIQIHVKRIPVYNVSLETQPPGGYVMEGEKLVLVCLVPEGTGDITFLWYKGALGLNLESKTQRSLTAKFEIPMVRESDAEKYYCTADNGYGPSLSGLVSITVRIPVSRPVLTLRAAGAQKVVGDVIELHCEAWRGSPPILYQFYHENVTMGNSSAPFGGGASFNFSLTAEHVGNYFCEANNGLGTQCSEVVTLNITVSTENRKNLTSAIFQGLPGILVLTAMVLLFFCWLKRKIGKNSARDPCRSLSSPEPQGSSYVNSTATEQLQPIYENVNVVSGDEVYSLVYYMQQGQQLAAESLKIHTEEKDSSVIYSGLKKARLIDVNYEDAM